MTDKIEVPRELLEELRDCVEDAAELQVILKITKETVVHKDYTKTLQRVEALLREAAQPEQGDEELRRDAERYRVFRAMHWDTDQVCAVMNPKRAVRLGHHCPSGSALDSIIDSIAAEREGS